MNQKNLDKLIKDTEWSVQYHQTKLFEAQATLIGLNQITHIELTITESPVYEQKD
tara:strand:- start:734 stop:898 length:165 start_codon:yes stop_codon:yes gene_type:complete